MHISYLKNMIYNILHTSNVSENNRRCAFCGCVGREDELDMQGTDCGLDWEGVSSKHGWGVSDTGGGISDTAENTVSIIMWSGVDRLIEGGIIVVSWFIDELGSRMDNTEDIIFDDGLLIIVWCDPNNILPIDGVVVTWWVIYGGDDVDNCNNGNGRHVGDVKVLDPRSWGTVVNADIGMVARLGDRGADELKTAWPLWVVDKFDTEFDFDDINCDWVNWRRAKRRCKEYNSVNSSSTSAKNVVWAAAFNWKEIWMEKI